MILQAIHKRVSKLYIILPLVALITFLGYESKANPVKLNYSADEIFKGLFFAEGPVAAQIPELEGVNISNFIKDDAKLQNALDYQQRIFEEVKRSNQDAIDGLSNAINSGNLLKIEQAIGHASQAMLEAVNTLSNSEQRAAIEEEIQTMEADLNKTLGPNPSEEDLNQAVSKYMAGLFSSDGYTDIQALILYLVVFFAIAVYAAVYAWTQGPRSMVAGNTNDMYKESIVMSVSKLK